MPGPNKLLHAPEPPQISQDSLEKALLEARSYCLSGVCLGQSVKEVRQLGVLSMNDFIRNELPAKLECSDTPMNLMKLRRPDGTELTLRFIQAVTKGALEERFRASAITLPMGEITEVQLEARLQTLLKRFGSMRQIAEKPLPIWATDTPSQQSRISVNYMAYSKDPWKPVRYEITASVTYSHWKRWLAMQDECMAGVPKV